MPTTFLTEDRVMLLGDEAVLRHAVGLQATLDTHKPPAYHLASLSGTTLVALPDTPTNLVLTLEPADDPYYEAEFADDNQKTSVAVAQLRKGDVILIQARGAALDASHIGAAFKATPDGAALDLTASTGGYLRIVSIHDGWQPYLDDGKIYWARPQVGDTNVFVVATVEV